MAKDIQLIIPLSGRGQRFLDAGYPDIKPLIDVDGKPIIEHVLNLFPGTTDVIFIINENHIQTTPLLATLKQIMPTARIVIFADKKEGGLWGPVPAVLAAAPLIDDTKEVIVSYCDYGTVWDYQAFLDENRTRDVAGAIACYKGFHPHMLGTDNYAFVQEQDRYLTAIQEKKPFTTNRMQEYASNGTYYFATGSLLKQYFQEIIQDEQAKIKGEYYVSVVYNLLVRDGWKVNIFEIEKMLQWGTPYDLEVYKGWSHYFANIIHPQPPISNPSGTTTIFPMAGRGSRFTTQGYTLPKPFLNVNGKPMYRQALDCLPTSEKIIFIHLAEHTSYFFQDEHQYIALTEVTRGQACTCEIAVQDLDPEQPIMITACDNGVYYDASHYAQLLADETNDVLVWSFKNNQTSKLNPHMYAWLLVDEQERIQHVSCKKFIYDDPLTTPAIIGTMFFRKARYFMEGLQANYTANITSNGEFYVDDVLNQNIKQGLTVKNFGVDNYICWGTPADYQTYLYWQEFFHACPWHPYDLEKDITALCAF